MNKLIFVYNANSGKSSSIIDGLHKMLKPSTYECELCNLTHGIFREKREWKRFRDSVEVEMEFLYRNEFQKTYASKFGYKFEYPVVLMESDKGLEMVLSKNDFQEIENIESLIKVLNKSL